MEEGFANVERLRLQNASLLRKLQENQHELRHSVQSAKGSVPAATIATPSKEHSMPGGNRSTRSILLPSHLNSQHLTSTPKLLPKKTYHASPTHRSRTEILDTTPQEILSSSIDIDIDRFRHLSSLGPLHQDQSRHVQGFVAGSGATGRSTRKKRENLSKRQQKHRGKVTTGQPRRSPRNVSFVSAPGPDRTSSSSKHARSLGQNGNHKVLNASHVDNGKGVTPKRHRPQSAGSADQNTLGHRRHSLRRPHSATPTFGSSKPDSTETADKTQPFHSQFLNSYYADEDSRMAEEEEIRVQRSQFPKRLLDDGNVRRSSGRHVVDTTPRPKSILHTPANKSSKVKNNSMRVSFRESPTHNRSFVSSRTDRSNLDDSAAYHVQPLLGYDWIAGLLDTNGGYTSEIADGQLAELQEFRRTNYEDCVHKSFTEGSSTLDLDLSQQGRHQADDSDEQEKTHKCIHNYTLNKRLFPVPLHGSEYGESLCAICNSRRKLDSSRDSPSYIRVSVPRSTLRSPYQVRPHRRKSFDPTDSVGLSQHCLAGWENSVPSMMPAATNIDLKDSLGVTISQSQSLFIDREDMTGQPSRPKRPLLPSAETQQLLDRSRSLKLELQKLERAGLSKSTRTAAANRTQQSFVL